MFVTQKFQSHLGSILPRSNSRHWRFRQQVSIPPWFDFARAWVEEAVQARGVSIPPWFDFARGDIGKRWQTWRVSIPPWFDFAHERARGRWRAVRFQSHLGSILPSCQHRDAQCVVPVSIPPWFDFAALSDTRRTATTMCFNPTLVRFCPALPVELRPFLHVFQSHLGSILP